MTNSQYLNVDEVLSSARALAMAYPGICRCEDAPLRTVEGRVVPLLWLSTDRAESKPVILVTAGVHAREWVPPDASVYFAADLLAAYTGGTGLRYGGVYYESQSIRALLDQLDWIILPCVNPDGRRYSQNEFDLWRGNRNVVVANGRESFGVDLNRNYDFLWDFKQTFHPAAQPASEDPFDTRQTYHGTGPASEPEVRNVVSAMDRFPVKLMVDVHSAYPAVLHSWGHDNSQKAIAQMNFGNTLFDGQRGVIGDSAYREFHPAPDEALARNAALRVSSAVAKVRGDNYAPMPAHQLGATSGAGDDFAYARHLHSSEQYPILAFTLECGREFQPSFPEAHEVMKEVAVALLEFGRASAGPPTS